MSRTPKLKVYGWTANITEPLRQRLGLRDWIRQARATIAAPSLKAVRQQVAEGRPLFNLTETGNTTEIARALAQPGVIFVTPLDGPRVEAIVAEPNEVS